MKLIKPVTLTDAMLVSSTAPENDFAAWNIATAYIIGDKVIRLGTHRIYECLVASTGDIPEDNLTGTTPIWLDIAPTNRWAMFDNVVGTQTTDATPLTVVVNPGNISGLALMELSGTTATITLKDSPSGTTVYSKVIDLDGTIVNSVYDWFFQPFDQLTDLVITDMPFHYTAPELTVTLTTTSGNVSCGVMKFGEVVTIGGTQYGVSAGITDYSIKQVDAFGNYTVVERSFAKTENFKIALEHTDFSRVFKELAAARAIPSIWIGTEESGYSPLLVYGFYKDFSIDIAYQTLHYCTLEIEGLI